MILFLLSTDLLHNKLNNVRSSTRQSRMEVFRYWYEDVLFNVQVTSPLFHTICHFRCAKSNVEKRGSVPVAISLAFYQSTPVSEVYSSLGFLVSIIAVVTVNLLPRAKLIQMTLTICLFTAIAIPVTMLATWSGLQARFHTDPQGLHKYNSSQSGTSTEATLNL